jgi:hypothetical protein
MPIFNELGLGASLSSAAKALAWDIPRLAGRRQINCTVARALRRCQGSKRLIPTRLQNACSVWTGDAAWPTQPGCRPLQRRRSSIQPKVQVCEAPSKLVCCRAQSGRHSSSKRGASVSPEFISRLRWEKGASGEMREATPTALEANCPPECEQIQARFVSAPRRACSASRDSSPLLFVRMLGIWNTVQYTEEKLCPNLGRFTCWTQGTCASVAMRAVRDPAFFARGPGSTGEGPAEVPFDSRLPQLYDLFFGRVVR